MHRTAPPAARPFMFDDRRDDRRIASTAPSTCTVLVNPRAGRGKALQIADGVTAALESHGWRCRRVGFDNLHTVTQDTPSALLACCGDGGVRAATAALAGTDIPLLHVPCGTANLFSGWFGGSAAPEYVARTLSTMRSKPVDTAVAEHTPFALMCGVGPDAGIVARASAARGNSIRKGSYTKPVLHELRRPSLPVMDVLVDGNPLARGERGQLLIANCPAYAAGLDPAPNASMTDGALDVVFLPAKHGIGVAASATALRLRLPIGRRAQGTTVRVVGLDAPLTVQADGSPVTPIDRALTVAVKPRSLRVLLPADEPAPMEAAEQRRSLRRAKRRLRATQGVLTDAK